MKNFSPIKFKALSIKKTSLKKFKLNFDNYIHSGRILVKIN